MRANRSLSSDRSASNASTNMRSAESRAAHKEHASLIDAVGVAVVAEVITAACSCERFGGLFEHGRPGAGVE